MTTQDSTPSFAQDIRSLFRELDRYSMRFAFDLWDYNDVRAHAEEILDRVSEGSMPCDETWSDEQVAIFERWIEGGMPA